MARRTASATCAASSSALWPSDSSENAYCRICSPRPSEDPPLGADRVEVRAELLELVADPGGFLEAQVIGRGEHLLLELDHQLLQLLRRLRGSLFTPAAPAARRLRLH